MQESQTRPADTPAISNLQRHHDALVMRVLDLEQWRRRLEHALLPPCPWWCKSRDVDHRTEWTSQASDDPGKLYRYHLAEFADGDLAVVQEEDSDHGRISLQPPMIRVYNDKPTVGSARSMSEGLAAASVLLERITPNGPELAQSAMASAAHDEVGDVPPCPTWCVLPATHDLDDEMSRERDGSVNRLHEAGRWIMALPDGTETTVTVAQVTGVGANAFIDEESPSAILTCPPESLDAARARELAAMLFTAAERLDTIEATR